MKVKGVRRNWNLCTVKSHCTVEQATTNRHPTRRGRSPSLVDPEHGAQRWNHEWPNAPWETFQAWRTNGDPRYWETEGWWLDCPILQSIQYQGASAAWRGRISGSCGSVSRAGTDSCQHFQWKTDSILMKQAFSQCKKHINSVRKISLTC